MRKLRLTVSTALLLLLIGLFSVVAFAEPTPAENQATYNNPLMQSASPELDNGMVNTNRSGIGTSTNDGTTVNDVIKSDGMIKNDGSANTHRTHGEYQNNTNSCASCHQTHTAESKSLLFKDGVYNTCTACHDGTLGFYNVFATGANASASAGTFGGTHDGNMSVHLATGAVNIKAAPGGNPDGGGAATDGTGATWTAQFTCASCHSPHGSYSDRLLHYSPNNMGNTLKAEGGIKLADVPIVSDTSGQTVDNVLLKTTLDTTTAADYGLSSGDVVIQMMKKSGSSYVKDTTPWLYGYAFDPYPTKKYWTFFQKADNSKVQYGTANVTFEFGKGYAYSSVATAFDGLTKGTIARAYLVDLDETSSGQTFGTLQITKTNVATLWSGGANAGKGVAMSSYCSACHTDYLAKSGTATGTFDTAYRHTTNSDTYTCVRCHFAHGTDASIMKDAEGHTVAQIVTLKTDSINYDYWPEITDVAQRTTKANDYILDKNPSSALKRFTNMAVCWSCHTSSKAEQLKNNSKYGDNDGLEDPHGLPTGN